MKNTFYVLLLIVLSLQCVSALFGGVMLLGDTSGAWLQMYPAILKGGIFTNFLIPGMVLLVLLGVVPGLALYGMVRKPNWKWAQALSVYKHLHWGWTFALYTGLMLILWIDVQIAIIGGGDVLQTIYALVGVAITILALVPQVMDRFRLLT